MMILINKIWELFFPLLLVLTNSYLAVVFFRMSKSKGFDFAGKMLAFGALSYAFVNAAYTLTNWSFFEIMKLILHKVGRLNFYAEVVFSIFGTLFTVLGATLLVRKVRTAGL